MPRHRASHYINGGLLDQLSAIAAETAGRKGLPDGELAVVPSPDDAQSLLVRYSTATSEDRYIDKIVKIDSGAKSALDPNSSRAIIPYANDDIPGIDLTVPNVTIVDAERTFWDKVVILHGLRRWFAIRGELRGRRHRISRHYKTCIG